jgi:hypothetical protein
VRCESLNIRYGLSTDTVMNDDNHLWVNMEENAECGH